MLYFYLLNWVCQFYYIHIRSPGFILHNSYLFFYPFYFFIIFFPTSGKIAWGLGPNSLICLKLDSQVFYFFSLFQCQLFLFSYCLLWSTVGKILCNWSENFPSFIWKFNLITQNITQIGAFFDLFSFPVFPYSLNARRRFELVQCWCFSSFRDHGYLKFQTK